MDRPVAPAWLRALVIGCAAMALLLVGAALGLLIAQTRPAEPAAPAPDSVAVGFCQDMSVHHQQAILMAGIARDRSTDPAVTQLAFDIETSQLEQVGRMQGWLTLWGRDPLPTGGHMAWMRPPHSSHAGSSPGGAVRQMPGMATLTEIDTLRRLTGTEFDVLFLQLMLRHHQGGLPMMRYAAEHAEVSVVRNLASQMAAAQGSETELLTRMITERDATPLPAPS